MTLFNLVLVFGVLTCAALIATTPTITTTPTTPTAIASEDKDIEWYTAAIKEVKTKTGAFNLKNERLITLIENEQSLFRRAMSNLITNESSKNKELNRTMTTLTEVRVRLTRLSVEKRLLERFIPYEKHVLQAVEYGLKWLIEYGVTLERRELNNDTTACLSILHHLVNDVHSLHLDHDEDEDEESGDIKARAAKWIEGSGHGRKEGDVKVLKLELRQATTALREAERINVQLHTKLRLDRTFHNGTKYAYVKTIMEIQENVKEAEKTLQSFMDELETLSKQIETLTKMREQITKAYVQARDLADKTYGLIHTKRNAIRCFEKFQEIAIHGFDINLLLSN